MNVPAHYRPPRSTVRFRTGVVTLESAIVLSVLFVALFAMLDLGLAALRHNCLGAAAHRISREAATHGSLCSHVHSAFGPNQYSGTAAASDPLVQPLQGLLPTMQPELVSVSVTWPDGTNRPRDRVSAELTFTHQPLIPGLLPWGNLSLRAESTTQIVN